MYMQYVHMYMYATIHCNAVTVLLYDIALFSLPIPLSFSSVDVWYYISWSLYYLLDGLFLCVYWSHL